MKNYLFLVLFLLILGCKTAQKGFFYNHQSSFISVKEKTVIEPVYTSLEAIPVKEFKIENAEKANPISIENSPIQSFLKTLPLTVSIPLKKSTPPLSVSTQTMTVKSISRSLSDIYIGLSFVSLSILVMTLFGTLGGFTIVFGIVMLGLTLFFGIKGIRSLKNRKYNDKA